MAKFAQLPFVRMMMVRLPHNIEPSRICLHRIRVQNVDGTTGNDAYLGGLWVPFVTKMPEANVKEAFLWSGYNMVRETDSADSRMLAIVCGALIKRPGADSRLANLTDGQVIVSANPLMDYQSHIVHTKDIAEEVTRLMLERRALVQKMALRPDVKKAGSSGSDPS